MVRRIYDGWAAGDFSAGVDELDRHVTFVVSPDFPAFGVFVGLADTRDFIRDFLEQWEQTTIEQEHLQAVGDTVLAHVLQRSKGRASGVEAELRFFMLFTFRGSKIVRIETVLHEREALETVGLSEQPPTNA